MFILWGIAVALEGVVNYRKGEALVGAQDSE